MNEYSIAKLKNDLEKSKFIVAFRNFFVGNILNLTDQDKIKILELSLLLINTKDETLFELGYYIIVSYSINTKDYKPLYEISDNLLNFPVLKFLIEKKLIKLEDNLFNEILNVVIEANRASDNYYYTATQKQMNYNFFKSDNNLMVVAPTSFGKTDLIKKYVKENYENKTICIIEPTKAMLNQVKIDLLNEFKDLKKPKIITHYDMNFSNNENIIFVLTQERLFKLIYDRKIDFNIDSLLVDEAHNIFEKSSRAFLLAKIIFLHFQFRSSLYLIYFKIYIILYLKI